MSRLDGPYGKELPGILHRAGHTVVGTAAVGWPKQPRFVEEIKFTSSYADSMGEPIHECEGMDDEEFKLWIRGCDGYVTDIFTDVIEARAIIQHVARARPNEEEGESKKQYVALSNISTWANTTREADPDATVEDGEVVLPEPFKAEDRGKDTEDEPGLRVPHPRFKREAGFEQLLCNTEWFNVEPIVICTGVVYGDGEDWLHPTFQKIWLTGRVEEQALSSTNRVPMVHRADVLTAVGECFGENKPSDNYLLAVDEATTTWGEVAAAMRTALAVESLSGDAPAPPNEAQEFAELMAEAEHHGYPEYMLYKSDLLFDPEPFAALVGDDADDEPPRWRARKGIVAAMSKVVAEYQSSRMLGPKRIFIDTADMDVPSESVTELGDRLAARFRVPHVTISFALAEVTSKGPKKLVTDVKNAIAGKKSSTQPTEPADGEASAEAEDAAGAEAEADAPVEEEREEVPEGVAPEPPLSAAPLAVSVADSIQAFEPTRELKMEPEYQKITTSNKQLLDRVFRHVLSSHECRNHGFVLSGYPKTLQEAEKLFRDMPPAKPKPKEGEDEEPEEESANTPKVGKDGKVEGELLPQFTIVIEGPGARGCPLLPAGAAFVAASESSKERFQSVSRLSMHDLDSANCKGHSTEAVIQALGLPLHFEKDAPEEELLNRQAELQELDKVLKHTQEQQQLEGEEAAGGSPSKRRAALERRQEGMMSAIEEELLASVDPNDMAARDYALKYAMPALHKAMCMIGRLRPKDPVDFMSTFMMEYDGENTDYLEPGKLNLPRFGPK